MSAQPVKIISTPLSSEPQHEAGPSSASVGADDLFRKLAADPRVQEQETTRQQRIIGEIMELQRTFSWQEIIDLFHPLEDKEPALVELGLDLPVRQKIAFALGQIHQFDQALQELEYCLAGDPENFQVHSALAYNCYRTLMAAANREIHLLPAARKKRLEKAHFHMQKAQALMPERVTNFYREGKMYKDLERKPEAAIPLFAGAVANWRAYDRETKDIRSQERKNYIKALYNLASCELGQGRHTVALEHIEQCIAEDEKSGYVRSEHKYFALGKIMFALNRLDRAKQALECAATFIDAVEGNYIRELMGRVLLGLGDKEQALAVVSTVPHKARRPFVCWTLADCLTAVGRLDNARTVLTQSAQRDRRSRHKSLIKLARISYLEKDFTETVRLADEANTFHIETFTTICADALFWGIGGHLALGNREKAVETLREIESHRPGYPYLNRLRRAVQERG